MAKDKGLIHIYCGENKGKTTAAVGLAVRSFGSGFKVIFSQFLKTSPSGELVSFEKLGIKVHRITKPKGFTWEMNEEELALLKEEHNKLFKEVTYCLYVMNLWALMLAVILIKRWLWSF